MKQKSIRKDNLDLWQFVVAQFYNDLVASVDGKKADSRVRKKQSSL